MINNNDDSTIKFDPRRTGYYSTNEDEKTKTEPPAGGKDFRKVLAKDSKEGKPANPKKKIETKKNPFQELNIANDADDEGQASPVTGGGSIFDMPRSIDVSDEGSQEKPSGMALLPIASDEPEEKTEAPAESPSQLFSKMSSRTQRKPSPMDGTLAQARAADISADTLKGSRLAASDRLPLKKEKIPSNFTREQPDMSAVNQYGSQSATFVNPIADNSAAIKAPAPIQSNLKEIVDQIVKTMYEVKADGKTETVIELKGNVFEGAHLTVTSYDSARGEFNIAFDNLTPAAKQLLDQQMSRDSLLLTLQREGYNVHIMSTSTYNEERLLTENVNLPDDRRDQRGQGDEAEGGTQNDQKGRRGA